MQAIHLKTLAFVCLFIGILVACTKEKGLPQVAEPIPSELVLLSSNKQLFDTANALPLFTYYKNSLDTIPSAKETGHSKFYRVRFNSIALAALSDNGRLPANAKFPEGSMIVKELYSTQGGELRFYATMYKNSKHPDAVNGWLWQEIRANGDAFIGIESKGVQCTNCHGRGNKDFTWLFDVQPYCFSGCLLSLS